MKKSVCFSVLTLLLSLFIGCNEDNPAEEGEKQDGEKTETKADVKVSFIVTSHQEKQTDLFPSVYFQTKTWTGVEIRDPKSKGEYLAFQMVQDLPYGDANYGDNVLIIAGKNIVSFVDFNPETGDASNEVLNVSVVEDRIRFTQLAFNWISGEYEIVETCQVPLQTKSSYKPNSINVKGSTEDDLAQSFYDVFDKLGDYTSIGGHYLTGAPKYVTDIVSKVVVPFNKFFIYSYNPERQDEIREEELKSQGISYLVDISSEDIQDAWKNWSLLRKVKKILFGDDEEEPAVSEQEKQQSWNLFQNYKPYMENMYTSSRFTCEMPYSYEVSAQLLSVGKTTASIKADYSVVGPNPGFVSSIGFIYGTKYGEKKEIQVDSFPYTLELEGLRQGTTYTVKAYLRSQGITYTSEVEFKTDAEFSVEPQEIVFGLEGGEKLVYVQLGGGVEKWSITNKPDWCSIETARTSFSVKAEATEAERSGRITINGERGDGTTAEITLPVIQREPKKSRIVFEGTNHIKRNIQAWRGGDLYYEDEDEQSYRMEMSVEFLENGEMEIICGRAFQNWIVNPDERPSIEMEDSDYTFTYTSFEVQQDNTRILVRGAGTIEDESWAPLSDWKVWSRDWDGRYEYELEIKDMNTKTPIATYSDYRIIDCYERWKYSTDGPWHTERDLEEEWWSFDAEGIFYY